MKPTTGSGVALLLTFSSSLPVAARGPVIDAEFIAPRTLLAIVDLKRVDRVDEIPCHVIEALFVLWPTSPSEPAGLANPGATWQCCCDVSSGGPPRRRLIFAAGSPHLWAIYFEESGIAVERHFITFRVYKSGEVEAMESLMFPEPLKDVADIKRLAPLARTRQEVGAAIRW